MAVAVALPILGALEVSGAYVLGLISASADSCTTPSKILLKSRGGQQHPLRQPRARHTPILGHRHSFVAALGDQGICRRTDEFIGRILVQRNAVLSSSKEGTADEQNPGP